MKAFPPALAAVLALAVAPAALALSPSGVKRLPVDRPTTVAGIRVACTGVGQTKNDAAWRAYPVRVEFSDHANAYLGSGQLTLFSGHKPLLSVRCRAPWILMKLPAGDYSAVGTVPGAHAQPRGARFHPPAHGQTRVVLQFKDL